MSAFSLLWSFAWRFMVVVLILAALLAAVVAGWKRERELEEWRRRMNEPNRRKRAEAISRAVNEATREQSPYATPGYRGALRRQKVEVVK